MKFRFIPLVLSVAFFYSCRTTQLVKSHSSTRPDLKSEFVIVSNDTSMIIPVGVYPDQKDIEKFVVRKQPSIQRIDSLIFTELINKGHTARIVGKKTEFEQGANYVTYQDYWAWDFKKYMHVLKIFFYSPESGEKILEVVSQGNKMGMHDYPNPRKQVPVLIEKALKAD
ncbi:hypothetical protein [Dyadobacter sp. CY312]|uniref:hypothetical protein n=1 Tax=Dyadobacter sp. CY312 TaxID=2907303 RepID=UPI001F3CE88A|nr:hypothetical protein [Dyadobacter sp. CY312]MCE7040264.1 hypothetical protein [Dyadobacter sp. CY312]